MTDKFHKKLRKIIVLLIALNFLFTGSVFGQDIPGESVSLDDPEIFPFSQPDFEERTVDYTEDFYEVTDEGVVDPEGYVVEESEEELLTDEFDFLEENLPGEQDAFEAYRESIIANWGGKKAFAEHRLQGIEENLEEEEERFEMLNKEIEELEKKLEPIHQEIQTLKDQIDLLNRQLVISKNKITNAELQIAEKQIALKDLMHELERSEIELSIQSDIALEYIVLVYEEEEKFLDYYDKGSSTLKLLLADNSVSENLLGQEYLKVLEETGRKVFYDLYLKRQALDEKREKIQSEQARLEELYVSLNQERRILQEGRQTKKDLLEKTRGEEELYQQLLEESIQQQLESAIAIQNLRDNIEFIEGKLELLEESLETMEELAVASEESEKLEEMQIELEEEFKSGPEEDIIPRHQTFMWPIPANKITAYFEDPTYPKRWGVHKAVDIRAKQFTEIRAPANAYVFQTKDNGMGYSYIILAHKNQLITVYGHVSEILVKAGTVVKQGEVIGLTGGTPGTKGAGWQTTGPHLHFEVWYRGEQVDPLDWLPVHELPIEYIPDRFLITP